MSLIKLALEKEAGFLDGALALGKGLMKTPAIKNAAIGAGTGMFTGAISAKPGETMSGALKGAAIGGLAGGVGTIGKNVVQGANQMGVTQQAIQSKMGGTLPGYGSNLLASMGAQKDKIISQVSRAGLAAKTAYNS